MGGMAFVFHLASMWNIGFASQGLFVASTLRAWKVMGMATYCLSLPCILFYPLVEIWNRGAIEALGDLLLAQVFSILVLLMQPIAELLFERQVYSELIYAFSLLSGLCCALDSFTRGMVTSRHIQFHTYHKMLAPFFWACLYTGLTTAFVWDWEGSWTALCYFVATGILFVLCRWFERFFLSNCLVYVGKKIFD